jgi:retinol dehydrogenase 14
MVTGATSGIGEATAAALAAKGTITIIVGRNEKKCKETVRRISAVTGNHVVDYLVADLSSRKDIYRLAEEFKARHGKLDVLVNNAGAKFAKRVESAEGYEMTFALNHLAYFLLTNLLLDSMKIGRRARIVNVASGSHGECPGINFDDLQCEKEYVGKQAYAQSKLANILFTYELARRLKGTVVTANALHPGGVATAFCRNNGWVGWLKHVGYHFLKGELVGPKKGARTSIYLATSSEVEGMTGKYFIDQKPAQSSAASYDEEAAKRLWDISLQLTGLA